jgi:hypothetical protein
MSNSSDKSCSVPIDSKNDHCEQSENPPKKLSRRVFLGSAAATSAICVSGLGFTGRAYGASQDLRRRARLGRAAREEAARRDYQGRATRQKRNRDESRFGVAASFTKGLQHNAIGEASEREYKKLVRLIKTGQFTKIDNMNIGIRPLKNPQAGVALGLDSVDSHGVAMPPAPAFDSAESAAEMVELYWQAILRDVHFSDYPSDSMVASAVSELNALSDYRTESGGVSMNSLFRGNTPGDLAGPYVSQFLMQQIPFGSLQVDQLQKTVAPVDYMTSYEDWLQVQNGNLMKQNPTFDATKRHIRNGRDLSWYVWNDRVYQAYFTAASRLVDKDLLNFNLFELKLDVGNPYRKRSGTEGFVTFGDAHILCLLGKVAFAALKAVWYQKWFVHRRMRPETFGGRVHNHRLGLASYPIHPELLNATALDIVFSQNGTYLLPQSFIEGSPMHPSYGAGHATVAGACTTVLKAFFDESMAFPNPVVASSDGTTLESYVEADAGGLTIGGELNKLAANMSIGRNFAGIHYRSDYWDSLALGEEVAIRMLKSMSRTLEEKHRFHLTRFDGKQVVIRGGGLRNVTISE